MNFPKKINATFNISVEIVETLKGIGRRNKHQKKGGGMRHSGGSE
jgi:hypothetical protein